MDSVPDGKRIEQLLTFVYDEATARSLQRKLQDLVERYRTQMTAVRDGRPHSPFSERDIVLITYGDQISEPGVAPLQTLDEVLHERIASFVNSVHILPFYPYTSDDGFSVVDYKAVDPALGDWNDIDCMSAHFRLMFDAVINHISQASDWFRAYLRNEQPYAGFFISVDPSVDLSAVVRPRTTPLMTPFNSATGTRTVWTTFSDDQVDLNYADPELLLRVMDVLLFYMSRGAKLIRLDAIAFMWKEVGTSCLHLPQTHALIQFMRTVLNQIAPDVLLVTETNVPHADNISYFGDGHNEAQMVYNFPLPPLTLHTFQTGDSTKLTAWAKTLETPSDETAFFNFMASHDGIGLRPVEGILSQDEVARMATRAEANGGYVSYKTNSDGTQSAYEMNIVYYDALNSPESQESQALQVKRFLCSQAILVSLAGVPGIYVHSLFGSRNWRQGVEQSGRYRTINRRKFRRSEFEQALDNADSVQHQVFAGYRHLIETRIAEQSFHPSAKQVVLDCGPSFFVVRRESLDGARKVLCIHNVTGESQSLNLAQDCFAVEDLQHVRDLLSNDCWQKSDERDIMIDLGPYAVRWLQTVA